MWCPSCKQDTAAVPASGKHSGFACMRCSHLFVDAPSELKPHVLKSAVEPAPLRELTSSTSEQRLRRIGQQLQNASPVESRTLFNMLQVDLPHNVSEVTVPHQSAAQSSVRTTKDKDRPVRQRRQSFAWLLAVLGAFITLGGITGLVVSLAGSIPSMWSHSLVVVLGGQSMVILSLLQVLASLWQSSRVAHAQLHSLEREIEKVQQTADTIAGSRETSAAAFYGNLVRQSSPHILVANLQSQLSSLAAQIND